MEKKNSILQAASKPIYESRIGNKSPERTDDSFLSPKNAAKYLEVSVKLIYKLIETGQIQSQPIGKRLKRIRKSVLDSWLSAQLKGAQSL